MTPEKHCTYCGVSHADPAWPKRCPGCGRTTYRNPTPVTVVLLPVRDPVGLVVIRRGIEPQRGQLALPGGYVDWEESWQEAGAREVLEETGYVLDPARLRPFDVGSPGNGRTVLIFGLAEPIDRADLPAFNGTNETTERTVIESPEPMAFELHTRAVETYFRDPCGADPYARRLGQVDLERMATAAQAKQSTDPEQVLALAREVQRARAAATESEARFEEQRALLQRERESVRMLKKMLMERGGA